MSMNINGLGNTYNSINTNSKQYKALKEKGWLSGVIENESMMSPEEKMIYEIFGGRDTIIKNLMKQFDSDGDLLNANGVAGMDVTGKGTSWQKLTNVSEDHRQKMFDNVKREFIQEKATAPEPRSTRWSRSALRSGRYACPSHGCSATSFGRTPQGSSSPPSFRRWSCRFRSYGSRCAATGPVSPWPCVPTLAHPVNQRFTCLRKTSLPSNSATPPRMPHQ